MTPDTASYEFQRSMPLSADKLWPLLIDPKHRENWGVPDPSMTLEVTKVDTRVGGLEHHRCGPAENPEFEVETRWYNLTEPSRAVYTETLIFGGEAVATSLVTYGIVEKDGGSDLLVTVAASSFSGPEALDEMNAGWAGGLDLLMAYVQSQKAPI